MKFRPVFLILVLVHKCIYGNAPEYLSDLLTVYHSNRALRSGNHCLLKESRTSNSFGDRAFSNCAPKLWNGLPQTIRIISCHKRFKSSLKTHLFRKAYNL